MKLALISPAATPLSRFVALRMFWNSSEYTKSYRETWLGISAGILTIAGLTPDSFDIKVIDENFEEIDFETDYNLVGISAMTQQANRAYEIARRFREKKIPVVIGGIHATTCAEEAQAHCDSVVVGEAEYLWPELLDDFRKGKLKTLYNSARIVDLKDAPIPRYDLLKKNRYKTIWMQSTRGCPRNCEFCCVTEEYGTAYRGKSLEQILEEINLIKKFHSRARIGFSDENLLLNKKKSKQLLEKLASMKVRFHAQSDVSLARHEETLVLLKKAGCINVLIGFESLSEKSLENIDAHGWKRRQLNSYADCVEKVQSYGIGVVGAFIVGLDGDDTTTFKKTSDFIIDNRVYDAQITISTPLPNTRLRDRLEKENRLLPTTWEDYTLCDVTFKHPTLSKKELEDGLLDIYKSIHTEEVQGAKIDHFSEIFKNLRRGQTV